MRSNKDPVFSDLNLVSDQEINDEWLLHSDDWVDEQIKSNLRSVNDEEDLDAIIRQICKENSVYAEEPVTSVDLLSEFIAPEFPEVISNDSINQQSADNNCATNSLIGSSLGQTPSDLIYGQLATNMQLLKEFVIQLANDIEIHSHIFSKVDKTTVVFLQNKTSPLDNDDLILNNVKNRVAKFFSAFSLEKLNDHGLKITIPNTYPIKALEDLEYLIYRLFDSKILLENEVKFLETLASYALLDRMQSMFMVAVKDRTLFLTYSVKTNLKEKSLQIDAEVSKPEYTQILYDYVNSNILDEHLFYNFDVKKTVDRIYIGCNIKIENFKNADKCKLVPLLTRLFSPNIKPTPKPSIPTPTPTLTQTPTPTPIISGRFELSLTDGNKLPCSITELNGEKIINIVFGSSMKEFYKAKADRLKNRIKKSSIRFSRLDLEYVITLPVSYPIKTDADFVALTKRLLDDEFFSKQDFTLMEALIRLRFVDVAACSLINEYVGYEVLTDIANYEIKVRLCISDESQKNILLDYATKITKENYGFFGFKFYSDADHLDLAFRINVGSEFTSVDKLKKIIGYLFKLEIQPENSKQSNEQTPIHSPNSFFKPVNFDQFNAAAQTSKRMLEHTNEPEKSAKIYKKN